MQEELHGQPKITSTKSIKSTKNLATDFGYLWYTKTTKVKKSHAGGVACIDYLLLLFLQQTQLLYLLCTVERLLCLFVASFIAAMIRQFRPASTTIGITPVVKFSAPQVPLTSLSPAQRFPSIPIPSNPLIASISDSIFEGVQLQQKLLRSVDVSSVAFVSSDRSSYSYSVLLDMVDTTF